MRELSAKDNNRRGRLRKDGLMKVYVASSWRNAEQPSVVATLRKVGHEVYDFRHPHQGNDGFHWSSIDKGWKGWSPEQFREALENPIAIEGFSLDMAALEWADAVVLVLPCGRSAHLEAGWAKGAGKFVVAQLADGEPELMYRMFDVLSTTTGETLLALEYAPKD